VTIRILIADDHEVVRQGLRTFIESDPELKVVGEAGDGAEAVPEPFTRFSSACQVPDCAWVRL